MQIKYSKDADILLIKLRDGNLADSKDISECVIVHYDENKMPVEIEILDASQLVKLDSLDISLKEMLMAKETTVFFK